MIRFKIWPSVWIVFLVGVAMITACSVKEEREECPCTLMLDFSGLDGEAVKSVSVVAVSADGLVLNERVGAESFGQKYVRKVPHGFIQVSVWSGDQRGVYGENIVHIPYGLECPPVHLYSFLADTRGESCSEKVLLNKNYCGLTVMMADGTYVPYSLTFKGGINGYDMSGKPSSGEFACVAYPAENGDSKAMLPRQIDDSLILEVDDGVPHLKRFALGEYLRRAGYDWTLPSLEDVTVVLDYSLTSVTIQISGWDKEDVYNIIL